MRAPLTRGRNDVAVRQYSDMTERITLGAATTLRIDSLRNLR